MTVIENIQQIRVKFAHKYFSTIDLLLFTSVAIVIVFFCVPINRLAFYLKIPLIY